MIWVKHKRSLERGQAAAGSEVLGDACYAFLKPLLVELNRRRDRRQVQTCPEPVKNLGHKSHQTAEILEHQYGKSQVMQTSQGLWQTLVGTRQASKAGSPAQTAFNDPAPGHVFDVAYDPHAGTATWTDLSYDLGDLPITDVVRDDVTGDMYASSDFGGFRLAAGSASWALAAPGMPNVEVAGLTIVPSARRL